MNELEFLGFFCLLQKYRNCCNQQRFFLPFLYREGVTVEVVGILYTYVYRDNYDSNLFKCSQKRIQGRSLNCQEN